MSRHLSAVWGVSLLIAPAVAQAQVSAPQGFSIGGSVRGRIEAIDGQFRPATDDTVALLFRTLVHADYRAGPFTIGGELQDARVYFEHRHSSVSTTEVNSFEPLQAYVAADLGGGASVEAGRFTLDLGSSRLVARNAFRNTINAFAGARVDYRDTTGDKVTAFWTMPQMRLPSDRDGLLDNAVELDKETPDEQFFGISATKGHILGGSLEGYAYRLFERDSGSLQTRNRRLWTVGARAYRAPGRSHWDFDVEGAYQFGQTRASTAVTDRTDLDVSAGLAHASAGYTFPSAWSPRLSLAFDYVSGDHRGGDYTHFDPLFGARVFEFGPSSFYGPVGRANLVSAEARATVSPGSRWDGYLAARPLWLASATDMFANTGVQDPAGRSGYYAGTQIDGRARYWLRPDALRLSVGAALLAKGRFLSDAPNAPDKGNTHYGYVEVTYNF